MNALYLLVEFCLICILGYSIYILFVTKPVSIAVLIVWFIKDKVNVWLWFFILSASLMKRKRLILMHAGEKGDLHALWVQGLADRLT